MLAVLVSVLLAAQANAAAQRRDSRTWYQAYSDAQRAIQAGSWQKAIDDIQATTRLRAPKPGRNVLFYGDVYRDFNPDYYLGTAYLNLKRYDEADRAFERVRQADLIGPKDTEYAAFTRQASTAKFELLMTQAEQSLAANQFDEALGRAASARALGVDNERADAFRTQVNALQQKELTARASTTPVQTSAANAAPADLPSQGRANLPPVSTSSLPPFTQTAGRTRPTNPPPSASRPPAARPKPPVVNPTPPPAPIDERSALVDYFSGQYEAAASKLNAIAASPNASPRARFYLACSQAALTLTGKADASLLIDARAQLSRLGNTAQFAADKPLISPRIRDALRIQQ
jgi:tetratricopeptide (TPR) repeat protein